MAINKENGVDLGLITGTGVDSVTYSFGVSENASTEPTNWMELPPIPGSNLQYVWMKIKILLTNATSYSSPAFIVGIFNPVIGE